MIKVVGYHEETKDSVLGTLRKLQFTALYAIKSNIIVLMLLKCTNQPITLKLILMFILQVLMIDPDTPDDQIRKAYRKVVQRNAVMCLITAQCAIMIITDL